MKADRVAVTVRLPRALVKQAKHHAVDVERDFQDIVADALAAYLNRKGVAK